MHHGEPYPQGGVRARCTRQIRDVLPRIAQRLESEPLASATVLCPYQPGSMVFNRLRRLASQVLVLEFDQRWVLRPPRQSTERVGPAVWSVAFVHVSPR